MRHGLCVCPIRRANGQDKIFKCLWTGYGSRCQTHRFECVNNCNVAEFFNSFLCNKNGPPPKGHPDNLTQMLPTVVSSWLVVLWLVAHSWYPWEAVQRCSSWHTQTGVSGTYYHTPYKRHLNLLSLPAETAHIHIPSLTNPSLPCLVHFICTDWSVFKKWHQQGIIAFTWIHLGSLSWKQQVFLMFCPLNIYTLKSWVVYGFLS